MKRCCSGNTAHNHMRAQNLRIVAVPRARLLSTVAAPLRPLACRGGGEREERSPPHPSRRAATSLPGRATGAHTAAPGCTAEPHTSPAPLSARVSACTPVLEVLLRARAASATSQLPERGPSPEARVPRGGTMAPCVLAPWPHVLCAQSSEKQRIRTSGRRPASIAMRLILIAALVGAAGAFQLPGTGLGGLRTQSFMVARGCPVLRAPLPGLYNSVFDLLVRQPVASVGESRRCADCTSLRAAVDDWCQQGSAVQRGCA